MYGFVPMLVLSFLLAGNRCRRQYGGPSRLLGGVRYGDLTVFIVEFWRVLYQAWRLHS